MTGAVLVNDYVLKQLYNDPRNHIQEHEETEMLVGKPKGQLINWIAGEATKEITDALEQGSKELKYLNGKREKRVGKLRREIENKAVDAEDAYHTAEAKMRKAKQ